MDHINRKALFVSVAGGKLEAFSKEGELLLAVAIPPGRVPAGPFLELVPPGASFDVSDDIVVFEPGHRIGIQRAFTVIESGANPDFQPTYASRLEREMRVTISRMQAATKRIEARELALSQVERIPKPKDEPLVEVDDEEVIPEPNGEKVVNDE